jgi:DNA-binding LacI/PurR family transcriptional regulator
VDRFGLRFLERRGVKIPKEVGYASLDVDGDAADNPGISGIDQHSRMVGAAAVDMLIAAIHRGQHGITREPVRMDVEGDWIAGNTTRKLRAPRP